MIRRSHLLTLASAIALLLVACAVVVLDRTGCWSLFPTSDPSENAVHQSYFATSRYYRLRPTRGDKPIPGPTAEQVWQDLITGLEDDPVSRDLISRLYGGLPVEFARVKPRQPEDDMADEESLVASPRQGFGLAVRYRDRDVLHGEGGAVTHDLRVSQVTLHRGFLPQGNLGGHPEDVDPFGWIVEDYMLRHAPDWQVLEGRLAADGEIAHQGEVTERWARMLRGQVVAAGTILFKDGRTNRDIAARRAELDGHIQSWAGQAKEHYSRRIRIEPR